MIDLVLVNPNARIPAPLAAVEPPLWLGLIAGYRIAQGESVEIVDAEAEGLTIEQTVQRVNASNPREILLVVMGNNPSASSTPKMPITEELLKHLPQAKITGLHPTAVGHPRAVVKPFEGFPFVPWHLLPLSLYRAHNWHCLADIGQRSPYGVLYTSLNCPFTCAYCNVHTLYGDRVMRERPLTDIKGDLFLLASRGIRNLKIWDELFCLNEERVIRICDHIISASYDFNIWAYARVDTVSGRMLGKLKQAGVNWLAYGFESANGEVREKAQKRITDKVTRRAIDETRDAGINIMANFVFGLPGDTEDSMKANLDMAIQENFEYVNFYVALPYPGSEWYNALKEKPTDWASFSQFSENTCGAPEAVKFRDKAFKTYFSRPEYLSMVRGKFGVAAKRHIVDMLQWKPR